MLNRHFAYAFCCSLYFFCTLQNLKYLHFSSKLCARHQHMLHLTGRYINSSAFIEFHFVSWGASKGVQDMYQPANSKHPPRRRKCCYASRNNINLLYLNITQSSTWLFRSSFHLSNSIYRTVSCMIFHRYLFQ